MSGRVAVRMLSSAEQPASRLTDQKCSGDTAETRSHFIEFERLEINGKWHVVSSDSDGDWRYRMKIIKRSEAADNLDYNSDGDKIDHIWIDNGSLSDGTNSGF